MTGSVMMIQGFGGGSDFPLSTTHSIWRLFLREMSIIVEQKAVMAIVFNKRLPTVYENQYYQRLGSTWITRED
ncbi:hypothetical protein Q4R27_15835 [Morganella morganii subsp. sibonii]